MALAQRVVRVVLATPAGGRLAGLAQVIGAAGDMTVREIAEPPAIMGKNTAQLKPDVVVFYYPRPDTAMVGAMKDMLDGCQCNILILSPRPVLRDPRLDITRVGALIMNINEEGPSSAQQYHDVLTRIRGMGSVAKSRGNERGDAIIDKSFVLPEGVLSKYIIAIGSSTGGTEALAALFRRLPHRMPGIVVVQHMPPVFTKMYADRLNNELPFKVTEATHGATITPGSIHIAPGSNHLTIKKTGPLWQTQIGGEEKVGGHCPSVDVLFESVAQQAGGQSVGIILTGMGADGARGMLSMRRRGAFTIGQDEESCVVYGMPKKAFEYGAVMRQAALNDIPRVLLSYLSRLK